MENKEKKLQELYIEFSNLDHNIKQMHKQMQILEAQLAELIMGMQSLDELKKVKAGTEILVPISSGVYAKAELKDNENLIVNVGANTTVIKGIDSTKKIIENQIEEMRKIQEQMIEEIQQLASSAAIIEKEMNKIASEK